ncbi:MAG: hypothetical protein R3D98_03820 [Candidatus Krumholzibacteriia bacterium]
MDWHELNKKRVADLRDMMKEHFPAAQGIMSMKKETLVTELAAVLGIEQPHKVVEGIDKTTVKAKIKAHKEKRAQALAAGDHSALKTERRKIHALKRRLRKAMSVH